MVMIATADANSESRITVLDMILEKKLFEEDKKCTVNRDELVFYREMLKILGEYVCLWQE